VPEYGGLLFLLKHGEALLQCILHQLLISLTLTLAQRVLIKIKKIL
jgi:hypothetical protein